MEVDRDRLVETGPEDEPIRVRPMPRTWAIGITVVVLPFLGVAEWVPWHVQNLASFLTWAYVLAHVPVLLAYLGSDTPLPVIEPRRTRHALWCLDGAFILAAAACGWPWIAGLYAAVFLVKMNW